MPNAYIADNYPDVDFVSTNSLLDLTKEQLADIDIFLFNRYWLLGSNEDIETMYNGLKQLGAKVVLDMDDYWVLESGHPMYVDYVKNKTAEKLRHQMRLADHIITTTTYLAEAITPLNKNITILPNEPYDKYQQFVPDLDQEQEKELTKFGWFGAAQHTEDIELLRDSMQTLCYDNTLNDRYRIYLAGWNEPNPIYKGYEQVFSNNNKNPNYGRIKAADIYSYVSGYNFVNVALAPLKDTKFNKLKSELKIVEAGWMNKAIITSDIIPYSDVITHNKNGILIPQNKKNGWHKAIKTLINDKDMRIELANNLTQDIKKLFDIKKTGQKRYELYQQLTKK
jgi:glycosyltransferase involved in cell wall biosynthesis